MIVLPCCSDLWPLHEWFVHSGCFDSGWQDAAGTKRRGNKQAKKDTHTHKKKIPIWLEVTGSDTKADVCPDLNALVKNNCQQFSGDDCLSSFFTRGSFLIYLMWLVPAAWQIIKKVLSASQLRWQQSYISLVLLALKGFLRMCMWLLSPVPWPLY